MVKLVEVLFITLLVIIGFLIADIMVQNMMLYNTLQRFGIRLGLTAQFLVLIYLFFDSRDISHRLRRIEHMLHADEDIHEEMIDTHKRKEETPHE